MKKLLNVIVLGFALTFVSSAHADYTKRIRCESTGHNYKECAVGGELVTVRLVEQLSNAPCRANITWGADWHGEDYIWVDNGCRAIFRVTLEDEDDDDDDDDSEI